MVNILGIFAFLLLGVSAYFAYQNQGAYKEQIAARQLEEKQLKAAQDKLVELKNQVVETEDSLAEKQSALAELEAKLVEQDELATKIEEAIEDQKLEVDAKKSELAEAEEATKDLGDADELIAEVKGVQLQNTSLEAEITTAKSKRNGIETNSEQVKQQIASTRSKISLYSSQSSSPNLNTSISQVYNHYGFVTLRGGDNAGIIKGSTLDVVRSGETIAKLLVTTVETGSAAADIIPDSLLADTRVHSGDKVIAGTPVTQ